MRKATPTSPLRLWRSRSSHRSSASSPTSGLYSGTVSRASQVINATRAEEQLGKLFQMHSNKRTRSWTECGHITPGDRSQGTPPPVTP